MPTVTPQLLLMFAASATFQLVGIAMLPLTRGFTAPLPTLALAVSFLAGLGLMARLIHSGVSLGILVPILSALVPLVTIAVGLIFYDDTFSLPKICALLGACGLIGWAASL